MVEAPIGTRTWLIAGSAAIVVGGATALVWRGYRSAGLARPAAPAVSVPDGFGEPARCAELAAQYVSTWESRSTCSAPKDCQAEARGGFWVGLDGCFRIAGTSAGRAEADELAELWLQAGCAHDFDTCPAPPRATCESGRCVELPPASVPVTWVRVDVLRTFTFYRPPELSPRKVLAEDSHALAFESPTFSLSLDYGPYADPLEYDLPDGEPTMDQVIVYEGTMVVGGRQARRVMARNRWGGTCPSPALPCPFPHSYSSAIHIPDVPSRVPSLLSSGHRLTVVVGCHRQADCSIAEIIFRSLTFW